jgi:hypothetical protein
MRKLLLIFPLVLTIAGVSMLFERRAYAYADPGTGLLAIQAAGSALVATGWYLRRKIYAFLHRGKVTDHRPEQSDDAKQDEGSSRP